MSEIIRSFVTTSLKSALQNIEKAKELAKEMDVPFVKRRNFSLKELETIFQAQEIMIVSGEGITVHVEGEEFFFHPGMAKIRINALKMGNNDRMIMAMNLKPGDTVLDCTLGLGKDALVCNYVVGATGQVTGLEVNSFVATVVREGIKNYKNNSKALTKSLEGIKVINVDHRHYLPMIDSKSYDVVYFDPMFRHALQKSEEIAPLRKLADHSPLQQEVIKEACRIAKKRVVIKETYQSNEFLRLGFNTVIIGKNSPIAYGVINVGGEKI